MPFAPDSPVFPMRFTLLLAFAAACTAVGCPSSPAQKAPEGAPGAAADDPCSDTNDAMLQLATGQKTLAQGLYTMAKQFLEKAQQVSDGRVARGLGAANLCTGAADNYQTAEAKAACAKAREWLAAHKSAACAPDIERNVAVGEAKIAKLEGRAVDAAKGFAAALGTTLNVEEQTIAPPPKAAREITGLARALIDAQQLPAAVRLLRAVFAEKLGFACETGEPLLCRPAPDAKPAYDGVPVGPLDLEQWYVWYAHALDGLGRLATANAAYEIARSVAPNSPFAGLLAASLQAKLGAGDKAKPHLAALSSKGVALADLVLALVYTHEGDFAAARSTLAELRKKAEGATDAAEKARVLPQIALYEAYPDIAEGKGKEALAKLTPIDTAALPPIADLVRRGVLAATLLANDNKLPIGEAPTVDRASQLLYASLLLKRGKAAEACGVVDTIPVVPLTPGADDHVGAGAATNLLTRSKLYAKPVQDAVRAVLKKCGRTGWIVYAEKAFAP